jgi:hypothetical protein
MVSKLKYEYLLGFIAIIWVLFFSFILQLRCNYTLEGDPGSYLLAAKKLYLNFAVDDGRPLFISAIIGFPFLFGFNENFIFKWIFFVNLLCWLSTVFLVYKIIITKKERKVGFYYTLIFLFCVGNLAIVFQLLSESVFIFMLVLSVFFINKYQLTNDISLLTITVGLLFLTILIKPIAIGLVFILLLFFYKKLNELFSNKFSFFILFSLILIFFQMYSLKKDYGNFTISYIDSFTYYNYLGTRADCLKNKTEFMEGVNQRYVEFSKLSSYQQRKTANQDFINQIKHNPINLFKAYIINISINSSKGSPVVHGAKNENKTFYFNVFQFFFKVISKLQNIFFTLTGIYLSIAIVFNWKKEKPFFRMLSLMILYLFLVSAISCDQGDRFHIVFYPLILLLSIKEKLVKIKLPFCNSITY